MKVIVKKDVLKRYIAVAAAIAITVALCVHFGFLGTKYNYTGEPYVCLDAGHGADDVGAVNGERYEKDDNLTLTLKVREKLEAKGIRTLLTREDDSDVTLGSRCKTANKNRCTLFVSIHRNSADDKKANGIEAWIPRKPKGDEAVLAEKLLENICKVTEQPNRGVKKGFRDNGFGDYYINADTDMPSLLLEVGFITNTGDNQVFDEKLDETAEAIAETIYSSIKR